jgi:hypothetical protein
MSLSQLVPWLRSMRLLELGVDVHGHVGVGVADLAHDPFDVEVACEQRDRDVRASQRVRARVGQRRESLGGELAGGCGSGLGDDSADAFACEASAAEVLEEVVVGPGGVAGASEAVDVVDGDFDEVGAHLDLADAGLGLGVGDVEVRAGGVVEAQVADSEVAQLADAGSAVAEIAQTARRPA